MLNRKRKQDKETEICWLGGTSDELQKTAFQDMNEIQESQMNTWVKSVLGNGGGK